MLVTPQGKAKKPIPREQLGWFDGDIVFVVVGTRLENELTDEFIDICNKLLAQSNQVRVVFLGSKKLELGRWFEIDVVNQKRVENLGFRHDFPEVCLTADVYLNPDRAGGGTSAQTAIINQVPIVSRRGGHISAFLPEQFKHDNWDDYLSFALELIDNDKRRVKTRELFEFFVENSDAKRQYATIYKELSRVYRNY